MYFDIKHVERVDDKGNRQIELQAVLTAPQYDDLKPSDMSLENQTKAGLKLNKVRSKGGATLENADKAESALYRNGESVVVPEPVPEPAPESSPEPTPQTKNE